jgi:hypothetical protein
VEAFSSNTLHASSMSSINSLPLHPALLPVWTGFQEEWGWGAKMDEEEWEERSPMAGRSQREA